MATSGVQLIPLFFFFFCFLDGCDQCSDVLFGH